MSNLVYRERRPWRDGLLLPLVLCISAQACSNHSTQSSESVARQSAAIQAVSPTSASPKDEQRDRPTELVIKFRSSGPHAVTECAETWLKTRRSFRDATADRSDSLDVNFRNWKVSEGSALVPGRTGLSTAAAIQLVQTRLAAARSRFPGRAARSASSTNATGADFANVYRMKLGDNLDAERAAKELSKDPHIEYAQPNYKIHSALIPNDPFFSSSNSWGQGYDDIWAVKKIGAPTAWDTTQGDAVIVAVVDTGADPTHPDLMANLWTNPREIPGNGIDDDNNGFVDDVRGWNFASGTNDPTDGNGHGTHVSGTIAAVGNNGQGIIGIAPKARILPVKGLDDTGSGSAASLASAIIYAAQNGADVINNSWGCSTACPSNPVVESAVAQAHGLGATVVFAAGNSSADIANFSPQNQPDVIVVSASDQNDQRTSFSNFGMVDVAAPGGAPNVPPPTNEPDFNILSLRSAICAPNICQANWLVGTNLLRLAGTSMATPHVSGLAALIVKQNPSYSPEEVRQVIRKSAVDISSTGFDTDSGYGRISASNAVIQSRPLAALITAPLTALDGLTQVDITGTAMGTGFASWRLDYGSGTTPTTFTTIATSTVAVNQARLTTWNLSTVPDGMQTLRLVATNTSGQTYEDRQPVSLDNVKITSPASGTIGFVRTGDVINILGTVSPANLVSYSFSIAKSDNTPLTGANLTLPNGGSQKVVNGLLATWNTAGVPADAYNLSLKVNVTGADLTDDVFVVVDPTLHAGWPKNLPGVGFAIPDALTAADINGDGTPEIIVGYPDRIQIFDHTGTSLPGWPQLVGNSVISSAPSVGDITGDGIPEIVSANNVGQVFVMEPSGNPLSGWPRTLGAGGVTVALEDMDGNGIPEIIAVTQEGNVNVLRGDGTSLPGWPVNVGNGWLTSPAIADVQANGSSKEIAVATLSPNVGLGIVGTLRILSSSGTLLPGWPVTFPIVPAGQNTTSYQTAPVLGDIDGDGALEVIMGAVDGSVYAYHNNGTLVAGWPKTSPTSIIHPANSAALADFDGDGRLDVIVGRLVDHSPAQSFFTNDLNIWRGDGTSLAGWPVSRQHVLSTSGFGVPLVADIDGDGIADVVSWSDDDPTTGPVHSLNAYQRNAASVAGFPKITSGIPFGTIYLPSNAPVVGDFDHDGMLELAFLDALGNLFVWDLNGSATTTAPWPGFQHDAQHTGRATPTSNGGTGGNGGSGGASGIGGARGLGGAGNAGGSSSSGGVASTGGSRATGGSNGTGGVPATGGRTGTGGSMATGGSHASGGSTGSTVSEPCTPSATITGGQSGNFNTAGPYCFRTPDNIVGWGCSNFNGRSIAINSVVTSCSSMPLPIKFNGYYYFQASAGVFPWASIYWWQ